MQYSSENIAITFDGNPSPFIHRTPTSPTESPAFFPITFDPSPGINTESQAFFPINIYDESSPTNSFNSNDRRNMSFSNVENIGFTPPPSPVNPRPTTFDDATNDTGASLTGSANEMFAEFNEFYKEPTESNELQNWNFNDMYVRSNSPMASNCNSDIEIEPDVPNFFVEDDFPRNSACGRGNEDRGNSACGRSNSACGRSNEDWGNSACGRSNEDWGNSACGRSNEDWGNSAYEHSNESVIVPLYLKEMEALDSSTKERNISFVDNIPFSLRVPENHRTPDSPKEREAFFPITLDERENDSFAPLSTSEFFPNGVHRDFNNESNTTLSGRNRSSPEQRVGVLHPSLENNGIMNDSNRKSSHHHHRNKRYKKFTYEDIEQSLSRYYDKNEKNFTKTELFITYLTGMRTIYIISKNITQFKSYSIAMSTISITICLAVVAPFIKDMYWSAYLISAGNALATILISLSRYFKFDSNSAQYAFMAKQFNKLETRVEYETSIETPSSHKMREIESNMMELNEYIQDLIPEEAVQLFPLICRTNILQFIKKIEIYRKNLIIRFRDIKNEIHYILYKWTLVGENADKIDTKYKSKSPQQEREKNRVLYLMGLKEKTKKELMDCKNIYNQIDELFKKEIRYAESNQSCFGCSGVFKPDYDFANLNPVVRDYLKLVTPD